MNTLCESLLETIIRHPEAGDFRPTFGGELKLFLKGEESGGWLTAGIFIAPPDNGPPIHVHTREDEFFIVLEGRFSFYTEGKWTEGGPGTTVFLPRHEQRKSRKGFEVAG